MDRSNVARLTHTMKRLRTLAFACAALAPMSTVACDGEADANLVARAQFVETYVDLRVSALRREDETLTDSARAAVLSRHGVTEDQLLDFASAHGSDLEFMRDLWNEVEARLDSIPVALEDPQP